MHDPRIGRFFAVDPLAPKYPHNSPYAFSENRVIDAVELEGLEMVPTNEIWDITEKNTSTSSNYTEDLGGAGVNSGGAFKVGSVNGEAVRLYEIKQGPNKGNYYGAAFENKKSALSGEGEYMWKYVIGSELVSDSWNTGELGPVSTGNRATAWWYDEYDFSSSLQYTQGRNYYMSNYGVGSWNPETGEFVDASTSEYADAEWEHWKSQQTLAGWLTAIGTSVVVGPKTKTPAAKYADRIRNQSAASRPNTVAVIETADGKFVVGHSQGGVVNAQTTAEINEIGINQFHGQCAEVNAIARARNLGYDLKGAKISVANVRGPNSTTGLHGTAKKPCSTCKPLVRQNNLILKK